MKITTIQPATGFRALKVSYGVEEKLMQSPRNFVNDILSAGEKLENTQYMDLLIKQDFSFQIKEKANPFFALRNPIHYKRTGEKQIQLTGIYDGLDSDTYKKGDKISILLEYPDTELTKNIFSMMNKLRGILRFSYITKLLDENKIFNNPMPKEPDVLTKAETVSQIMYKYGDIVK